MTAGAQGPSPRTVAAEVHRAGGYPDALSVDEDDPPEASNRWNWNLGALGPLVRYFAIGAAILGIIAVVILVLRNIRTGALRAPVHRAKVKRRTGPATASPPRPTLADDPWLVEGDADALAAAGRYEEAMGALLLRALRAAGWGQHGTDRSVTAREVVAALGAVDPRRPLLGDVVSQAELVRFGGRPATAEGVATMRERVLRMESMRAAA